MFKPRFFAAALAASGFVAPSLARAQGDNAGWQSYQDPRYHFTLQYPRGWSVQTNDRQILVTNPERSAFALIENFKPEGDETAEDHVDELPKTEASLLHGAVVKDAFTLGKENQAASSENSAKAEQAAGVLAYRGQRGTGTARFLCMISPAGGILFGVGARDDLFPGTQPTLVKVVQSLRFPSAAAPASGAGGGGGSAPVAASAPPPGLDSTTVPHFVHWVDPNEKAYSCDVPQGWKVEGGLSRASPLDARMPIMARSPHDEMAAMIGDAALSGFTLPSQRWAYLGKNEGDPIMAGLGAQTLMHYMPAPEFNHWYLGNYLSRSADDVQIGEDTEHPETAQKLMDMTPATMQGRVTVTVCGTRFTCRSKINGRQMAGVITSSSSRFIGNAQGDGTWSASPSIYVWATGDNKASAREATAKAVCFHMNGSFLPNQQWMAENQRRVQSFLQANQIAVNGIVQQTQENIRHTGEMAHQNAVASDDRRAHMMGTFHAQMAAKDDNRRKMQNYSLDQTDVTNGSSSWKVGSGYSHYYHNAQTNTIVGTNSASSPGVDFTPLEQR